MWLYVPGSDCVPASGALNSRSDFSPATDTDVWVTLSGKPTQRPLSWRGWKQRPWIERLYGTISDRSRASSTAIGWITSLPDSHASRSASRASAAARSMTDGSGLTSGASPETSGPTPSSSRTSLASEPRASSGSLTTLPKTGGMRSGACFERPILEPPISATDSSSWPTPTATSYGNNRGGAAGRTGPTRHSLDSLAKTWPTPTATDAKASGSMQHGTATHNQGMTLWDRGSEVPAGSPVFPPGPDDADGWEQWEGPQPSIQRSPHGSTASALRRDRLRTCGNAVVPVVAAYAYQALESRYRKESQA